MRKSRCGECGGKSEAVSSMFPFCSECDFVAATAKQFQEHVLNHERVWWRATRDSFFEYGEENSTSSSDLPIPTFEEYLKIIGLCRSCSFLKQEDCDLIKSDEILGNVSDLFARVELTSTPVKKPQPVINNNQDDNTQVSLQSP